MKGLCDLNINGIQKYPDLNSYPGIKRHFENISKNKKSKIQRGNAIYLSIDSGVPLQDIIVM